MARSSGEQPRNVKRRYARRGGSIPPRAEQQEQSIFCTSTLPPLETVQPTERRTQGRQIHTGGSERRAKNPNNNRIGSKGLGNAHFFGQPERRQIKNVSQTACRRAKTAAPMADIAGIARVLNVNPSSLTPPIRCCFSFAVDAKHLARSPGSIPGSAPSLQRSSQRKEGKHEA